jgi:hypothetical protein
MIRTTSSGTIAIAHMPGYIASRVGPQRITRFDDAQESARCISWLSADRKKFVIHMLYQKQSHL